MSSPLRTLYRDGHVYAPGFPFATAVMVEGGTIAWIGDEVGATAYRDVADVVVDCGGAFIAPGFVDAHVHATATGLAITGLDLSGYRVRSQVIDALSEWARTHAGATLIAHGWDETQWDDPRPLERTELDRATWGSVVFVSRIDVHSAVVSSALLATMPQIAALEGFDASGLLHGAAVTAARARVFEGLSVSQRSGAQVAFLERAAQHGIVWVHEMAGPSLSSVHDAQHLRHLSEQDALPGVSVYWGELAADGGVERAHAVGAVGVGGDLFVDGSIGSHTAFLRDPYHDASSTHGLRYLTSEQVADHVVAATMAGFQAGFHVIGDAAMDTVITGLEAAVRICGVDAIRGARHRLEHAEMMDTRARGVLKGLGVTVSMQPMFDALWGGAGGMYAERLGAQRAASLNAFAEVAAEGLLMAFGSDAPVTQIGPWAAVAAAMHHPSSPISARASFHAHTRAGWRAIGHDDVGVIAPGSRAHLAIWNVPAYLDGEPDDRVARWSTDPRSGTPDLPDLRVGLPQCLRTIRDGRVIWDAGVLT